MICVQEWFEWNIRPQATEVRNLTIAVPEKTDGGSRYVNSFYNHNDLVRIMKTRERKPGTTPRWMQFHSRP